MKHHDGAIKRYKGLIQHLLQRDRFAESSLRIIADNSLDIDAFSEEFDLRMRWGRDSRETCSTVPRPSSHAGHGCRSPAGPGKRFVKYRLQL